MMITLCVYGVCGVVIRILNKRKCEFLMNEAEQIKIEPLLVFTFAVAFGFWYYKLCVFVCCP